MELQNVKEYEYIRTETEFIRNCITSYMGFVIGGSGAAMFGLAALRVFGPENRIAMSYVSFAVSLLVALVLSILFYKFNSHNRYVGYSRVLADETYKQEFHEKYNHEAAHVAWELCMERLRMADGDSDEFRARAKELPLHGQLDKASKAAFDWMLDSFLGRPGEVPFVDRGKFVGGLRHLCLSLAGKRRTTSWAFPPTVVSVFFVLTVIYLLIGTYGTATYATDNLAGMLKDPW